jgi:Tol biopolymer transport system component
LRAKDQAGAGISVDASLLRELAWAPGGRRLAGVVGVRGGSRLWTVDSAGQQAEVRWSDARLSYPVWLPDGRVACLALAAGRQRVTLPCGEGPVPGLEEREAYGPLAASPDGRTLYLAMPNDSGFVDLWSWDLRRRSGQVLASHARDAYAPSVAGDGTVLYKVQEYSTRVAVLPAEGGAAAVRTAFQSETPSWDPTGSRLGITYGTWRRVVDDFHYPDIAQEVGIVSADGPAPADRPDQIVQDSPSEDQGLIWSPNGRWIAFHSHQQQSDDIWIRPADRPEPPRRLTGLGRGAEVGWPRWSPDGRWVIFNGDTTLAGARRSVLWIVGVDQTTGQVTQPLRPVPLGDFGDQVGQAEWLGSSESIAFTAARAPDSHGIYRVARQGGTPRLIHAYTSPQRNDGLGASPDGRWVAFVAPDSGGRLQLFRVGTAEGSRPEQLTFDAADKTQPAVSPDGRRIAFTIWRYEAHFWTLTR